jgi:uncharacterized protein (DUF342 family)
MLGDDGKKLLASFLPRDGALTLDLADVRRMLVEDGWGEYFFYEPFLAEVVRKCQAGQAFEQVVGEARDAEFSIQLDNNKMAAHLSIIPATGGKPVDRVLVYRKIEELGIVAGLDFDAIDRAIAAGKCDGVLIASGRQPRHGEDGRLECLLPDMKERRPRLDSMGIADYRNLGDIMIVKSGAPLMRRVPPTEGVPGETVLGQVIPAVPGKGAMFAANLSGVDFDPADPNVLAATITGQPVQVKNGVVVEPTYVTSCVDLSTGNIVFDGSVKVQGDVQAGMLIQATGDILIEGTVEAAALDAGGQIVVKGGIIGRVDSGKDKGGEGAISHIRCNGAFTARFVQNAQVEAGDSIYVDEVVMQSDLVAANQIVVGKGGTSKGHIIGGSTMATLLVRTRVLGSPSHIRTVVGAGVNPRQHEQLRRLAREREEWEKKRDDVDKLIVFAAANPGKIPPPALEKAEYTHKTAQARIELLRDEQEMLSQQLTLAQGARIIVEKTLCGGAEVQFAGRIFQAAEDREGGMFCLRDGELEYDDLPREMGLRRGAAG